MANRKHKPITLEIAGKTSDSKLVILNLYEFLDRTGLPLEDAAKYCQYDYNEYVEIKSSDDWVSSYTFSKHFERTCRICGKVDTALEFYMT